MCHIGARLPPCSRIPTLHSAREMSAGSTQAREHSGKFNAGALLACVLRTRRTREERDREGERRRCNALHSCVCGEAASPRANGYAIKCTPFALCWLWSASWFPPHCTTIISSTCRSLLQRNRLVVFQPLHLVRREEAASRAVRHLSTRKRAVPFVESHHLSIKDLYSDSDSVGENGATEVGLAWPSAE